MKSTIATIDFGTSKIVTLVAEQSSSLRCNILGRQYVEYDGYSNGQWNNPEQLNDVIEESITGAEKQAGKRIKEIHLGVPADFTRVYVVEVNVEIQGTDPHITEHHVRQIFEQADEQASQVPGTIIYRSPAWFMVDGGKKTLKPVGLKGSQLKALVSFVLADNFFLADVSARISEKDIIVKGFFSSSTGEAMLLVPQTERDHTAMLIDVGYLCTDVMIIEGDAIIFQQTLQKGGVDLTISLVNALQIQMNAAEEIKRQFVYGISAVSKEYSITEEGTKTRVFSQEEISAALQPQVDELCEMIQNAVDESGIKLGNWSNCYLTGGGIAFNQGGKEYISSRLERNVRDVEVRTNKLSDPNYSSALGLLNLVLDICETQRPTPSGIGGFFKKLFGD